MNVLKRLLILVLAVLAAGCYMRGKPGAGVDESLADTWGCNYEELQATAEKRAEDLESGHSWVPQVGWDVCYLFASVGRPDRTDTQAGRGYKGYRFWYGTGEEYSPLKLVVVDAGTRRVEYVDW